jgi:hypothetical protein
VPGNYALSAVATDSSGATNTVAATIGIVVKPLTVQNFSLQAVGQFTFSFQGQNGQDYVVEASTNLADWTPIWTNAPMDGQLIFTNIATNQTRFYRIEVGSSSL